MSRLSREFSRLYRVEPDAAAGTGRVRALVLELARPAHWLPLATIWQGVQVDLELPAPAIAVNGVDGLQLWFSLAQPVDAALADAFVQALGRRYLPDQPLSCLVRVAPSMPGQNVEGDRWSAFLAPDLVTLFAETPWLDLPPNSEGQAELLAPLASIQPAQWQAVLAQLTAVSTEAPEPAPSPPQASPAGLPHGEQEARLFLLSVVNDPAAPLALRVEAAKALVQATAMSR